MVTSKNESLDFFFQTYWSLKRKDFLLCLIMSVMSLSKLIVSDAKFNVSLRSPDKEDHSRVSGDSDNSENEGSSLYTVLETGRRASSSVNRDHSVDMPRFNPFMPSSSKAVDMNEFKTRLKLFYKNPQSPASPQQEPDQSKVTWTRRFSQYVKRGY